MLKSTYYSSSPRLILWVFLLVSVCSLRAEECNPSPPYYNPGINCGGTCVGNETCATADEMPDCEKCIDMTAVPELPSWFGPFFLATLVAAFEFWRNHHKRKTSLVGIVEYKQNWFKREICPVGLRFIEVYFVCCCLLFALLSFITFFKRLLVRIILLWESIRETFTFLLFSEAYLRCITWSEMVFQCAFELCFFCAIGCFCFWLLSNL